MGKKGYTLPHTIMTNSDLTRIINSDEIQSKLRPAVKTVKRHYRKKNPLKNLGAKVILNPYALAMRRSEMASQEARKTQRAQAVAKARAAKTLAAKKAHKAQQKKRGETSFARI